MANAPVQLNVKSSDERLPFFKRDRKAAECVYAVSDEELVEKSLKGEEDAFRQLYERYQNLVYSTVFRILQDPEDARDATQDIFILVHRSLRFWCPQRARFSSWIYRVATNHAIDHWRSRRRRAEEQMKEAIEVEPGFASFDRSATQSAENDLEHLEQSAGVSRILGRLPELQRRFIVLRYCDGLKLREIAEKEGYKLGTVKSTLHRATETMRSRMKNINN